MNNPKYGEITHGSLYTTRGSIRLTCKTFNLPRCQKIRTMVKKGYNKRNFKKLYTCTCVT